MPITAYRLRCREGACGFACALTARLRHARHEPKTEGRRRRRRRGDARRRSRPAKGKPLKHAKAPRRNRQSEAPAKGAKAKHRAPRPESRGPSGRRAGQVGAGGGSRRKAARRPRKRRSRRPRRPHRAARASRPHEAEDAAEPDRHRAKPPRGTREATRGRSRPERRRADRVSRSTCRASCRRACSRRSGSCFPRATASDRVRLLVKDPEWLFAYWDVDPRRSRSCAASWASGRWRSRGSRCGSTIRTTAARA